jgi:alkylation response protein AidB-like acyl-CoA dehydrogenase
VTATTRSPAEGLLERTAELVPMLQTNAAAAEEARRIPPENLAALTAAGVFRMTAPKRFDGYESDLQTVYAVLAEIGRGCPSSCWVATTHALLTWLTGLYPDETQDEVFATADVAITGAFAPGGHAVPTSGGVVVSGRWPFCSGCHGAEWANVVALTAEDNGGEQPVSLLIPTSELTILDDWYPSGMAATGSNTLAGEDIVVPTHRTLPVATLLTGNYPRRHNSDSSYFNFPAVPFAVALMGATPVGIARGALDAFLQRLPGRRITYTDYADQAKAPVTHLTVGDAALKIDSADAHVRRASSLLDGPPDGVMTVEARVKTRAHVSHAISLAREAVDALFYASGASSIQTHVPIQRFQRDMQAIANHALLLPATNTELYGRTLCGLEPNTPFI